MAEPFDEFDEPGAVAAGLWPDGDFPRQAGIEAADVIQLVIQFLEPDLTVGRVAVAGGLLTRVKIHTTIDNHGHILGGLMRKVSLPQLECSSRRCLLHHITTVLKQDQRTGRLTHGTVREVLTKSAYHPHGIKVRQ